MNLCLIVFIYCETLISFSNLSGIQIKNSLITLLTDFGSNSIQIARCKAWFSQYCPQQSVIDIAHDVHQNDINEAAYIFNLVQDQFDHGSIHVIAIDFDARHKHDEVLYFLYKGQHIITYNSGIASLLLGGDISGVQCIGNFTGQHYDAITDQFGQAVLSVLNNEISDKPHLLHDKANIKTPLNPVTSEKLLQGHVVYFDSRETCYTNISKELFDEFVQNDRFDIVLSRHERISKISNDLKLLEGGGTYCYFNKAGYLTISVYRGSAKRMYGLKRNHSLMIEKQ